MKGSSFYSKILLFGEYGIIEDSKGLSIPYNLFEGHLKIPNVHSKRTKYSNSILYNFCKYLKQLTELEINLIFFEKDLKDGLYFDSSIPMGYGVGSSGALVAAVYDKYSNNKIIASEELSRKKIFKLKTIFSKMESFFHGNSSGLDPLNSYLGLPILINSRNDLCTTTIPYQKSVGTGAIFLIDSGQISSTSHMVSIFMEKMKSDRFRKMILSQFIKYTNLCVDNFISGDLNSLFINTKKLSKIVLENFKPMIPHEFHNLWKNGIDSGLYFLKLCGSGGGGYILGFTPDIEQAKNNLKDYNLEVVYQF